MRISKEIKGIRKVNSRRVIFSFMNVKPSHDLYLVQIVVHLPVEKVDLLQELLLVEFQLSDHLKYFIKSRKFYLLHVCLVRIASVRMKEFRNLDSRPLQQFEPLAPKREPIPFPRRSNKK